MKYQTGALSFKDEAAKQQHREIERSKNRQEIHELAQELIAKNLLLSEPRVKGASLKTVISNF